MKNDGDDEDAYRPLGKQNFALADTSESKLARKRQERERERERNKYKAGGLIDIIHGYLRSLIWKYGCDIQGVGMKSDSLHAMGGVNPFLLMLPLQSRPESWMIELVQWRPGSRETRQKGLKRACLFVTPLMPSSQHWWFVVLGGDLLWISIKHSPQADWYWSTVLTHMINGKYRTIYSSTWNQNRACEQVRFESKHYLTFFLDKQIWETCWGI